MKLTVCGIGGWSLSWFRASAFCSRRLLGTGTVGWRITPLSWSCGGHCCTGLSEKYGEDGRKLEDGILILVMDFALNGDLKLESIVQTEA